MEQINTGNRRDTYNLDAMSPRTTNRKRSQTICGEAEEREDPLFPYMHSEKTHTHTHTDLTQRVIVRGVRLGGSRQKAARR